MCNKNAPDPDPDPDLKTTSMIKKEETTTISDDDTTDSVSAIAAADSNPPAAVKLEPAARRTRTRTRKPKFLSLTLELSPSPSPSPGNSQTSSGHHQLNLFPLHPENLVDDKDMHEENVDYYLLDSSDGGATLNGLLDGPEEATVSSEQDSLSPSLSYAYRPEREEDGGLLVRTAMKRSKERHVSEEKWVCYSEVVEKKEEEVTSCSAGPSWYSNHNKETKRTKISTAAIRPKTLSLKLDYQEILDAWSDKGSLYIEGGDQCPQTVPDLHDDDFLGHDSANVVLGSVGNLWSVPEQGSYISNIKMEDDRGKEDSNKLGQREASVLRYKEKRQTRLFSKRIRYEVRKLNAEKRPRMKGRFVRRN